MKTKLFFLTAVLTLSAMVNVSAEETPSNAGLAVVPVKGTDIVKVIYKSESIGRVKLSLYDAKSNLVFSETLNGVDGFILPLNLSGLSAGEYSLEIAGAAGKRVEKINYQPKQDKKFVHIARLINDEGKYLVSITNAGTETEMVSVKIYDGFKNLIHTETAQVDKEFARLYAIKNVKDLTIEVTDSRGNTKSERF